MQRSNALSTLANVLVGSSVVLTLSLFALPVAAQVDSTSPISVDISPQYPAPYQLITVTPSSSQFDMANSTVTVYVNGSSVYKGSGSAGIPVTVGGPGTATTIKVSITNSGQTYSHTTVIRPADVALVLDPVSTTHPFYEGASLVAPQGQVRIVAIPDLRTSAGKQLDASTLVYTWKLGDQVLEEDSGIGKNVLNATAADRYQDANVSVLVSTQDGSLTAEGATVVAAVDPITRIYFNDPLLGPEFDNALSGTAAMPDVEDTYRGVAYYFATAPTLDWTVDGNDGGSDQDVTVRATGNGQGTANLNFTATASNGEQTANSTLAVQFGQKGTGLFGL